MKKYECLYIVNINVDSEGTSAVSARVEGLLKNVGAELVNTQPWGKRKLAYAIDKERYGDYVLIHFQGENPDLADFHRELEIEKAILHYMTIRLDEFPDFDSLSVPQAIDTDRKRSSGPSGRRPRYEDRDAAPTPAADAASAEKTADAEAPEGEAEPVEDADAKPAEAPESSEEVTEEEVSEVAPAEEEATEETEPVAEEAPAEEVKEEDTDKPAEEAGEKEKPADSE
ncbi:MAG: 30S ribosomal protein S6 [Candidatus Marinimicrobia bacterium]|nr:30S ribosomal protein S6 [Candidatus Neomarinimicrobiota bacterium]MCF7903514.1 30S ribosomal protein S6 [Candidatus Neomarinimicrobiota bacterium]